MMVHLRLVLFLSELFCGNTGLFFRQTTKITYFDIHLWERFFFEFILLKYKSKKLSFYICYRK